MRFRIEDLNQFGAQNAGKLLQAQESQRRVDPRLIAPPADTSSDREEDVQAAVIVALRERGLRVMETSVRYRLVRCEECGHGFRWYGHTGQSAGIPDLLVRSDAWPVAMWLGLEIKGAKTKLSQEQTDLLAASGIEVARTPAQALAAVERADARMRSEAV